MNASASVAVEERTVPDEAQLKLIEQQLDLKRLKTAEAQLPEGMISERLKGLKVLGLVADSSACGYYRIILPLQMMRLHGAEIKYGSFSQWQDFLHYDVILVPRQHSLEVLESVFQAQWEGKLIVYEIDDALDHVGIHSPAYFSYHPGSKELLAIRSFLRMADGVTVTTPELAKWYSQHNQNMHVVENYIDFSFRNWYVDVKWSEPADPTAPMMDVQLTPLPIPRPPEWEGKITIAYSGGSTHQQDLTLIGPAIKNVLNKTDDSVLFVFYGSPDDLERLVQQYDLPRSRVQQIRPRHFMDFPEGLHGIDIGLAPITCDQFNLCKSDLKVREYLAAGIAAVASDVGPYARFAARHPQTITTVGRGAHCVQSWTTAIMNLVNNPELLARRKREGRQVIIDNYSLEANFMRFIDAWKAMNAARKTGHVGPPAKIGSPGQYVSHGVCHRNEPCPCGSGKKYKACHVDSWG